MANWLVCYVQLIVVSTYLIIEHEVGGEVADRGVLAVDAEGDDVLGQRGDNAAIAPWSQGR